MPCYETTFVLKPELDEEKRGEILEGIKIFIGDEKGEVKNIDERGMRKLAYEIAGVKEGFFVTINFQTNPSRIREIQKFLRAKDEIVRLMIVKGEEKLPDQKKGEKSG
jgi:small subunit ribosomal protein S6